MDLTLFRNGYNVERRKMYVENPRHNLRSSVDFLWRESLNQNPSFIAQKKELSTQLTKDQYTRAIDKRLQEQLKINKNTFRVMPVQQQKNSNNRPQQMYDSLRKEVDYQNGIKKSGYDSPMKERIIDRKSQSLSKSVFGYEIDHDSFKKESYLSKVLGDRLSPYLKKQAPKHQSFTINNLVSLQY